MKDKIILTLNVTRPEHTVSYDVNFSREAFKSSIKLSKLKRDLIKAQMKLISRFYNNAPIKYGIPDVPYGLYSLHRELIKQEAKTKFESRVLYLTYAFIRGVPRKAVEKVRAKNFADIVNGIRDMIPLHLLNDPEGALTMQIRCWYLGDEEKNEKS